MVPGSARTLSASLKVQERLNHLHPPLTRSLLPLPSRGRGASFLAECPLLHALSARSYCLSCITILNESSFSRAVSGSVGLVSPGVGKFTTF